MLPTTGDAEEGGRQLPVGEAAEKLFAMLPTTGDAEEGGRQLPVAKRRFRASFGRSRTPERTATCPMLCAQRSRFIACGWQRAR
ncbi:unnamed protein product [Coccothraustes coccothraustes]